MADKYKDYEVEWECDRCGTENTMPGEIAYDTMKYMNQWEQEDYCANCDSCQWVSFDHLEVGPLPGDTEPDREVIDDRPIDEDGTQHGGYL